MNGHFELQSALLMLLCWAGTARADAADCASVLDVTAPAEFAGRLRVALASGELGQRRGAPCASARVALDVAGSGWIVRLAAPDRSIARRVASIPDAAFWI